MSLQDAFHRYLDALAALIRARDRGGRDPVSGQTMDEAAEAYYAGLSATLNAFNAPSNWRRDGRAVEALPRQVAFDAGQIIEDLLDGRLRPSIDHLFFRRGRPGIGAIQRRAIEAAVRYVAAVKAERGII